MGRAVAAGGARRLVQEPEAPPWLDRHRRLLGIEADDLASGVAVAVAGRLAFGQFERIVLVEVEGPRERTIG